MSSLISDWPSGLTDEGRLVFFVAQELKCLEPNKPVNNYENDHVQSRGRVIFFHA